MKLIGIWMVNALVDGQIAQKVFIPETDDFDAAQKAAVLLVPKGGKLLGLQRTTEVTDCRK